MTQWVGCSFPIVPMGEPLDNVGFDWYETDLCCCLINTHFVFVFEWLLYNSASSCQVDLEIVTSINGFAFIRVPRVLRGDTDRSWAWAPTPQLYLLSVRYPSFEND